MKSFNVSPGGYLGFFDPETGDMDTYTLRGDQEAARRLAIKQKAEGARRAIRYQRSITKKVMEEMTLAQQDNVIENRAKRAKLHSV